MSDWNFSVNPTILHVTLFCIYLSLGVGLIIHQIRNRFGLKHMERRLNSLSVVLEELLKTVRQTSSQRGEEHVTMNPRLTNRIHPSQYQQRGRGLPLNYYSEINETEILRQQASRQRGGGQIPSWRGARNVNICYDNHAFEREAHNNYLPTMEECQVGHNQSGSAPSEGVYAEIESLGGTVRYKKTTPLNLIQHNRTNAVGVGAKPSVIRRIEDQGRKRGYSDIYGVRAGETSTAGRNMTRPPWRRPANSGRPALNMTRLNEKSVNMDDGVRVMETLLPTTAARFDDAYEPADERSVRNLTVTDSRSSKLPDTRHWTNQMPYKYKVFGANTETNQTQTLSIEPMKKINQSTAEKSASAAFHGGSENIVNQRPMEQTTPGMAKSCSITPNTLAAWSDEEEYDSDNSRGVLDDSLSKSYQRHSVKGKTKCLEINSNTTDGEQEERQPQLQEATNEQMNLTYSTTSKVQETIPNNSRQNEVLRTILEDIMEDLENNFMTEPQNITELDSETGEASNVDTHDIQFAIVRQGEGETLKDMTKGSAADCAPVPSRVASVSEILLEYETASEKTVLVTEAESSLLEENETRQPRTSHDQEKFQQSSFETVDSFPSGSTDIKPAQLLTDTYSQARPRLHFNLTEKLKGAISEKTMPTQQIDDSEGWNEDRKAQGLAAITVLDDTLVCIDEEQKVAAGGAASSENQHDIPAEELKESDNDYAIENAEEGLDESDDLGR